MKTHSREKIGLRKRISLLIAGFKKKERVGATREAEAPQYGAREKRKVETHGGKGKKTV